MKVQAKKRAYNNCN